MRNQILNALSEPHKLEALYWSDKIKFRRTFKRIYPELKEVPMARFWHERLNFQQKTTSKPTIKEILSVVLLALLAGSMAKLPSILSIDEEFFYPRNKGFIIFPALAAYVALKKRLSILKVSSTTLVFILCTIYINLVPETLSDDMLMLICIHLLVLQWFIFAFIFVGDLRNHLEERLLFLKFNADLIVMAGLLCIAGAILSGMTVGLYWFGY